MSSRSRLTVPGSTPVRASPRLAAMRSPSTAPSPTPTPRSTRTRATKRTVCSWCYAITVTFALCTFISASRLFG
jgi:hypothetical protein